MEPVMAICTGRTYPASAYGPRAASDAASDAAFVVPGHRAVRGRRRARPWRSGPTRQFVGAAQLKESPQAQLLPALGLSMVKPCFSIVSAKSIVAPSR